MLYIKHEMLLNSDTVESKKRGPYQITTFVNFMPQPERAEKKL